MKTVYKPNIQRMIPDELVEAYTQSGWSLEPIKAETINLKPAVKSKGTAKADPDNAIQQGDE